MANFSKKITYIYISQVCSMVLGMLSLLIVSPYVTSNKEVYGIYVVCLSLTVFFAYADIGFVGASQKYAAEAFIRGEKVKEMQILGFSLMVLLLFMGIICIGVLLFVYRPEWLIKNVVGDNRIIARKLLLILACTIPFYCLRRILAVFFSVRMQSYYIQVLEILSSFLTISVAPFFFLRDKYDIVGYYLTSQMLQVLALFASCVIAKNKLGISVWQLLRNIKFSREIFNLLRGLAFASLFVTICWILYYELDNIVISQLLGPEAVASFAVAFTILTVFRNLFGIMFGPYQTRFNYFVGLDDMDGLHTFAKKIMAFYLPICIVPIIVLFIVSKPFIYSWVGPAYNESPALLSTLVLCNVLAFLSYPSGIYIAAVEKLKQLYISSLLTVVSYWMGVLVLYHSLGILAFAVMKSTGMILSALYTYFVMSYLMQESGWHFLLRLTKKYLVPTIIFVFVCYSIEPYMMLEKGRDFLIINIAIIFGLGIVGYGLFFAFSPFFRKESMTIVSSIINKKT